MKRPEQALQIQVANYLRVALRPPTFWTSIEHATKLGPVAAAMRKARGVKAGLPDILVMHPPLDNDASMTLLGIELKAAKGNQSKVQFDVEMAFCDAGADYRTCWSLEDVVHALKINCIPLHAKLS